uniref:Tc3 transposase DNA binding domain-containing protein n=1 Tax=Globisporangium ultimum (strain ATCC 200006 / CBS 805.95 / DAOM BR144) TaxID=431595 RepID=K3WA71_GLOUD
VPKSTPLTELERGLISAYHNEKLTIRKIAERINRSSTVMYNFLQDPDKYETAKRSGRPPALKKRDKRQLKKHVSTGDFTANQLKKDLDLQVSVRTIQRELQKDDNLVYIKATRHLS